MLNKILKDGYKINLEKEINLKKCITFPNLKNINKIKLQKEYTENNYPFVKFPSLEGFFSDTLNDQIIKGIIIGNS